MQTVAILLLRKETGRRDPDRTKDCPNLTLSIRAGIPPKLITLPCFGARSPRWTTIRVLRCYIILRVPKRIECLPTQHLRAGHRIIRQKEATAGTQRIPISTSMITFDLPAERDPMSWVALKAGGTLVVRKADTHSASARLPALAHSWRWSRINAKLSYQLVNSLSLVATAGIHLTHKAIRTPAIRQTLTAGRPNTWGSCKGHLCPKAIRRPDTV